MYVVGKTHWAERIAYKTKNNEMKLEKGETQSDGRALL